MPSVYGTDLSIGVEFASYNQFQRVKELADVQARRQPMRSGVQWHGPLDWGWHALKPPLVPALDRRIAARYLGLAL